MYAFSRLAQFRRWLVFRGSLALYAREGVSQQLICIQNMKDGFDLYTLDGNNLSHLHHMLLEMRREEIIIIPSTFLHRGSVIAVGSPSGAVALFDSEFGKILQRLQHTGLWLCYVPENLLIRTCTPSDDAIIQAISVRVLFLSNLVADFPQGFYNETSGAFYIVAGTAERAQETTLTFWSTNAGEDKKGLILTTGKYSMIFLYLFYSHAYGTIRRQLNYSWVQPVTPGLFLCECDDSETQGKWSADYDSKP